MPNYTITRPFKFSKKLRKEIQKCLSFKLKINDKLRQYSKTLAPEVIYFDDLVHFIKQHRFYKRDKIPDNMLYNQHTKKYWNENLNGSFAECIKLWHLNKQKIQK